MKRLLTILLLILALSTFAQQDPLFSQYMFNKLAVNPAYAGSRGAFTGDVIYRYQWVNIPGAPKTLCASMHSPLFNPHIGLGLNMYNDIIGATVNQGALATFAYRIIFPESKLSFGLQIGVRYTDIDWNKINPYDTEDPLYRSQMKNRAVPDANFGVYYFSNKYYIGLSSKQLFQNQMNVVVVDGKSQYTKLMRHFYGMAGAALPISDELIFRPSLLAKFVQNAPPQMDLNFSFFIREKFLLGLSYRTEKAMSLMTEFYLTHSIRIGYAYDIWFNTLQTYNKGSHEVRLGFDLDLFHTRMISPRYF
jgi:type IX secretion system PorP/SprF family membrane protein